MTVVSSPCPDPEVIAAFVAGSLTGTELSMTAEHLRVCEDCREVAAEAARVDREGIAPAVEPKAVRSSWWTAVAAAAFAGLVILTYVLGPPRKGRDGIQKLVAAAPADGRYVEARLTGGFRWAPLRSQRMTGGAVDDPGRMRLIGAAGDVLQQTQDDTSPEARHTAAVAHLLGGNARQADDVLSRTASSAADARMWSDLAAIRYTEAVEMGDSAQLAEALAAADAALRIDPQLAEALFNRALIVEHLDLRDQARTAWERYLAVDSSTQWADEARRHLQSRPTKAGFRDELNRRYQSLQTDAAAARDLAGRYPEEARVWGETEILARWAEAAKAGDVAAAHAHLLVAGAFAEVTSRLGDKMLMRAVEAIEGASDRQQHLLANAHIQFRDAQHAYRAGQPAAAEALFADARRGFEEAGSPIALLAAYFGANTAYEQGRVAEACAALEGLAAAAPPEYPAHRAQVGWQLGLAHASMGHWGEAIHALSDSVATFEQLQENGYASAVRDILAEVYERIGERRLAWRLRIVALRAMGRADTHRLRVVLHAAALGSAASRDWPVTVSLLHLELELPADGDDLLYAESLMDRARIQARLGDHTAAASDLTRATEAISRLRDPSVRERAEADRFAVEASLERDPVKALSELSQAIEFHRVRGRRMFVPELLLERGRIFAVTRRQREAAEDFESGIRELETQRGSVGTANIGWGLFGVADELFEEAIGAAAARQDAAGALAYVERSRAQEDRNAVEPSVSVASIQGTTLVEYATLPDRVVILVVDGDRVRVVERTIRRADLASEIDEVMNAAAARNIAVFRRASSALYDSLLGPVSEDLRSAGKLTFVPDAALSLVPFGALRARNGRYVIEEHAVVTAPSYAWCQRLASRHFKQDGGEPRLLLIEGPEASDGESLWASRREADGVRSQYRSAGVALRGDALWDSGGGRKYFEKCILDADVIHFVGHAVMPDGSADAALVTSRGAGAAGRLEAGEIASMSFPQTRVVVLAACSTARDRRRPGELSISVARAFLTAGVPSVVATLWPIDDSSAAEFFPRLHAHLARGQTAAEALRATQLEWIHRSDASPGMWAAVQIIGI